MATRFYLPSTGAAAISPNPDAAWEDVSILARLAAVTTKIASAMSTVAFGDSNTSDMDVLLRQYVSAALTPGQTITGGQALKFQIRGLEAAAECNMLTALGVRVINDDLSVKKTVLAVTRDGLELDTSLTNRQFTATSAAGNYTTIAGDRIVIEIGTGGDPGSFPATGHDSSLRIGDASGSDLPESDGGTDDYNPWVELADTLTYPPTPISATESLGINVTDAKSTLVAALSRTESLSINVTDATSALSAILAVAESLGINITDASALSVVQFIVAADSLGINISESSEYLVLLEVAESLGVNITDLVDSTLLALVASTESLGINITDASQIIVVITATESFGINVTDASLLASIIGDTSAGRLYIEVYDSAGNLLGAGPIFNITSAKTSERLDRLGDFEFRMMATDERAELLAQGREIRVYREGETDPIFTGFIGDISTEVTP